MLILISLLIGAVPGNTNAAQIQYTGLYALGESNGGRGFYPLFNSHLGTLTEASFELRAAHGDLSVTVGNEGSEPASFMISSRYELILSADNFYFGAPTYLGGLVYESPIVAPHHESTFTTSVAFLMTQPLPILSSQTEYLNFLAIPGGGSAEFGYTVYQDLYSHETGPNPFDANITASYPFARVVLSNYEVTYTYTPAVSSVPEPGALLLLASGLTVLAAWWRAQVVR